MNKVDLEAELLKAAKPKGSKSKSKIPVCDVPELVYVRENESGQKETTSHIEDWLDADLAITTAESIKANAERELLPLAERLRLKNSQESHEFLNSVKLRATPGGRLLIVTQTKGFRKMDQDVKEDLQNNCEEEGVDYNDYFYSDPEISLNSDLSIEKKKEVIKKMIDLFGVDWKEYFVVKYPIKVNENFSRDIVFKGKVRNLFEKVGPNSDDPIVRPVAPSVKEAS